MTATGRVKVGHAAKSTSRHASPAAGCLHAPDRARTARTRTSPTPSPATSTRPGRHARRSRRTASRPVSPGSRSRCARRQTKQPPAPAASSASCAWAARDRHPRARSSASESAFAIIIRRTRPGSRRSRRIVGVSASASTHGRIRDARAGASSRGRCSVRARRCTSIIALILVLALYGPRAVPAIPTVRPRVGLRGPPPRRPGCRRTRRWTGTSSRRRRPGTRCPPCGRP